VSPLAALGIARTTSKEEGMLWLILGIILLVIAIAGGAIIHPVLFAIAIVALLMFFLGR
jgi:membrane protein implicated in regulation of membrane protease activity